MSTAPEFKEFTMRGNMIDLAVGMVVGTVFSGIVKSLVGDVIMPLIGILIGGVDLSNLSIALEDGTPAPEAGCAFLAITRAVGAVILNVDLLINTIISFLIIIAAVFVVVRLSDPLKKKEVSVEEAPAELSKEVLLSREIRSSLNKK